MITGIVKFFNTQKGFGFITPEDGSKDVFVHISGVPGLQEGKVSLNEGDTVQFETQTSDKGLNAINVEKIEGADKMAA